MEEENQREIFTYKERSFVVRNNTLDSFVVKEVSGSEYKKLNLRSEDVCLDLGMNIGVFSVIASEKCKFLYSFEPEPTNFEIANQNLQMNNVKNVKPYNAAVVGNDDKERFLSVNKKQNKGTHSLIEKRGRYSTPVACMNINKIIEETNPTVLKVDVEGAEYEILTAIKPKNFKNIREIIFEYHHAHLNDIKTKEKYKKLIGFLKSVFPNVDYKQETKGAWVSNVYCSKV